MYWLVFGVLLANASVCHIEKKDFKPLYYFSIIMLTLFLCLRYGQGTDYFAYQRIFELAPDMFTFKDDFYTEYVHGEIGWKLLCHAFNLLGFSYMAFIAFIGFLSMLFMHLFIRGMCPERNLALLLIFPTLYLTYFFSGLRQGLAMSVFLGLVLKCLFQKRYVMYILGVALCMTIHFTAAMYFFLLPVVLLNIQPRVMGLMFYVCLAGGIFLGLPVTQEVLQQLPLPGGVLHYLRQSEIFWPAAMERVVLLAVVLAVYFLCKKQDRDPAAKFALTVYILSVAVYMLLFWNYILSRLVYPLKLFEIILLAMLLPKVTRYRGLVFSFIILHSCVMVYKNIWSYITWSNIAFQMDYSGLSVFDYPYISIFNQEDIYAYRF